MNRRAFLSLVAAAPLAAALKPFDYGVVPLRYEGVIRIGDDDWHVHRVPWSYAWDAPRRDWLSTES